MQSLGYLPSAPTQVVGEFYHYASEEEDLSATTLKKKMTDLEAIVTQEAGSMTPQLTHMLDSLKLRIKQMEIESEIKTIEVEIEEKGNHEKSSS